MYFIKTFCVWVVFENDISFKEPRIKNHGKKFLSFCDECITTVYLTASFEKIDYYKIGKILRLKFIMNMM